MMESTLHIKNINGLSILCPNLIIYHNDDTTIYNKEEYNGYYISYNSYDIDIYGADTTALVLGQMQKFFILNGDHCGNYKKLAHLGFSKCFDYYKKHIQESNLFSDKI